MAILPADPRKISTIGTDWCALCRLQDECRRSGPSVQIFENHVTGEHLEACWCLVPRPKEKKKAPADDQPGLFDLF